MGEQRQDSCRDTALLLRRLIHYSPDLKNRLWTNRTAVIKQQGVDTNYSWLSKKEKKGKKKKAAEWEGNNNKRHQRGSWRAGNVLASSATLYLDSFNSPQTQTHIGFTVWDLGQDACLGFIIVFGTCTPWDNSSFENDLRIPNLLCQPWVLANAC